MVRGPADAVYLKLCSKVLELDPNPSKFIRQMVFGADDYDIFISHASEDRASIARPIFEACERLGLKAFLDDEHIAWGETFTRKINVALAPRALCWPLSPAIPSARTAADRSEHSLGARGVRRQDGRAADRRQTGLEPAAADPRQGLPRMAQRSAAGGDKAARGLGSDRGQYERAAPGPADHRQRPPGRRHGTAAHVRGSPSHLAARNLWPAALSRAPSARDGPAPAVSPAAGPAAAALPGTPRSLAPAPARPPRTGPVRPLPRLWDRCRPRG